MEHLSPLEHDDPGREARVRKLGTYVMFEHVMNAVDKAVITRDVAVEQAATLYAEIMGTAE
ncbi:hypothetical protein [Rhodococcus sp. NPDC004095]